MLDIKDFSIFESQTSFDFKGLLLKIGSYWRWFLLSLIITFTIAYQVNIRKEKINAMETLISVKEESNPLFTSTTSLVFNWGGTSDQVQTVATTLQSRSHNELVVDKLQYYIGYLAQGKYNLYDAYGSVPFYVDIDKSKGQIAGTLIGIKFLSANEYEIRMTFGGNTVSLISYSDNSYSSTSVEKGDFVKRYKVGMPVALPFLNWKLQIKDNPGFYIGNEYFVQFNDFDGTVSGYKGINVKSDDKGGSIITLGMQGTNKARMVEYLNSTVKMLIKRQLDDKNQFATNTIAFIDSTLVAMESQLKETTNELKSFKKDKNILNTIYNYLNGKTSIDIENPKSSFQTLTVETRNDTLSYVWSKLYLKTVTDYYIANKTKKSKELLVIMEKRVDSLRSALYYTQGKLANYNDQNQQIIYQRARIIADRLQMNSSQLQSMYFEAVRNYDNLKFSLIKESPLFTIITDPELPLPFEPYRWGRVTIIGLLLGFFLSCFYLYLKQIYDHSKL